MATTSGRLPRRLEGSDDDLFAADDERRLVLEFIRDLHNRDPKGDQGRYPTTTSGALSPAAVCCAYPHLFRQYVDRLFAYTQERISHAGQSV
ncbi:hypothetical protein [Streptomyces similanensis]|uniref:Uncharacterized protein n=1 Tax=Streptomyces similanensis TaxID=1274988 RepID=A0ABP9LCD3_9ACTN